MALSNKLKQNIILFKEYCVAFNLKIVSDTNTLKRWVDARGPMLGASFISDNIDEPPVAWISPDPEAEFFIEQNEDLLAPNEPAVAALDENIIRVAINNKRPIHPLE